MFLKKKPLVFTRGFFGRGLAVGNRCHGLAVAAVFGAGGGLLRALADAGVEDALAETDVERGGFDEFVGIDVFDGAFQ